MARVALICHELLLQTRFAGLLAAGGHQVSSFADPAALVVAEWEVFVVDLAAENFDGAAAVEQIRAHREDAPILGFYSHVDPDTRDRALAAGATQAVPRSRFMREGSELVSRLSVPG